MVKICEVVDGCEDCPKYGDDCDGEEMTEHTDYISRADAIEAVAQQWLFEASVGNPYVNDDDIGEYRKLAEELFEDVPSADAEQVVRCKECIYKYVSGNGTTQYYVCDFMDAQYEDDGFCHHGESEVEE